MGAPSQSGTLRSDGYCRYAEGSLLSGRLSSSISISINLFLCRHDLHVDRISRLLADGLPYVLADADDVADRPIIVLHAHVHGAAVVGDAVEGCMDLETALAEECTDVVGKGDIGTTLLRHCLNLRIAGVSVGLI